MNCQFFVSLQAKRFPPNLFAREFGWNFDSWQSSKITCPAIAPDGSGQDLNFGFRPDTYPMMRDWVAVSLIVETVLARPRTSIADQVSVL
jgi:hypothetical protein